MSISFLFLAINFIVFPWLQFAPARTRQHPELVVQEIHREAFANASRRKLGQFSCGVANIIDNCWRCDENWEENRQRLADCAIGFGKNASGGRGGRIYVVNSTEDDPVTPRPGTLRHAVIQVEPLWIIFERNMSFSFKEELIMASNKTIDGRGSDVSIIGPGCITVQDVSNIIIANIEIRNCSPTGNAMVRSNTTHFGFRGVADGDGISIFESSNVWVDHCSLSRCADGLIDAVEGSTDITVSNCYFSQHNEVMLLGHSDGYIADIDMRVTIAFNHFGEGLVQRMPRCRHGFFHVVCNDYADWKMYAIGGSANPTIYSQGNRFTATLDDDRTREVTKRLNCSTEDECKNWNWMSNNDIMVNGAYFTPSGSSSLNDYARATSLAVRDWSNIDILTAGAGVLHCKEGVACCN